MKRADLLTARASRKFCLAVAVGLTLLSLGTVQVVRALAPEAGTGSRLKFVPGSDSSSACASAPCGRVSIRSSGQADVFFTLGIDSTGRLQAETYYTDLLQLTSPGGSYASLVTIAVSGVSYTRSGDLGEVSVFYCPVQSDDPAQDCPSSYTISSGAEGAVFEGVATLAPGSTAFIEFAGYAGSSAQPGDSVTFSIQVTAG